MLKSIELRAPGGGTAIVLSVGAPSVGVKYVVKNIDGLGPVQANVSSSSYANFPGAVLDNAKIGSRNIVMLLKYLPDYAANETVQDVRRILYSIAGTTKTIELTFISDSFPPVTISGIVEGHTPTIFSKDTDVQLSVVCGDPYFQGELETINGVSGVSQGITAKGDVDPGYIMTFTSLTEQTMLEVGVYDSAEHLIRVLPPAGVSIANKLITVSTIPRDKFIHMVDVQNSNLLLYASLVDFAPLSTYLTVVLVKTSTSAFTFQITYTPLYEGL